MKLVLYFSVEVMLSIIFLQDCDEKPTPMFRPPIDDTQVYSFFYLERQCAFR